MVVISYWIVTLFQQLYDGAFGRVHCTAHSVDNGNRADYCQREKEQRQEMLHRFSTPSLHHWYAKYNPSSISGGWNASAIMVRVISCMVVSFTLWLWRCQRGSLR